MSTAPTTHGGPGGGPPSGLGGSGRPRLPERPCPACGTQIEPLRAREVVLLGDGFRYLCSADCRARFMAGERSFDDPRLSASAEEEEPLRRDPTLRPSLLPNVKRPAAPRPPWWGLGAAAFGALLGALASEAWIAILAFSATAVAAAFALYETRRSRVRDGLLSWLVGPLGVLVAAVAALLSYSSSGGGRLALVGAAVAAAAVLARGFVDAQALSPLRNLVAELGLDLPTRVRIPTGSPAHGLGGHPSRLQSEETSLRRVRIGEEILAYEGDVIGVDGVVQGGEAQVLLHPSSRTPVKRSAGDPVLAGAFVTEGSLRVLASRVGEDRALIRPKRYGQGQGEEAAPLTRRVLRLIRFGGAAVALLTGVALLLSEGGLANQLAAIASVLLASPLLSLRRASSTPFVVAAASAAQRGIVFENARALDRAGQVGTAAVRTRGAITEGEPEVLEIHPVGEAELGELLAYTAGAEQVAESHPIGRAIHRYVRRRRIEPKGVRRPIFTPGRGLSAVVPSGEELVVGNRQLLLDQGVSVAVADDEAARAESRGNTVVFVALGGRVRAVISLRDEEKPGARAAVQRLFDLGVEVLLLSGDHRASVTAVAKRLDINHVKAELPPEERAKEIQRLREGGGVVAVIGGGAEDELAMAAADVPVVLGAAGDPANERGIALTSGDVRDAAAALWMARRARQSAIRATLTAAIAGGGLVVLGALALIAPALAAVLCLGVDLYTLPAASRLLRRIRLRLPR